MTPALAALRWLCLAVSPLTPGGAARPPAPSLWPAIVTQADLHLLLPELWIALSRHDLHGAVPADLAEALEALHGLNRTRNACLREQMLELARALAGDGIAPIWLKGAVELTEPCWEDGGRMMNDLDLWIPCPDRMRTALARLERLGYRVMPGQEDAAWASSHHHAGRVHEAWPVRVEPHRAVIDPALAVLLPDQEALQEVEWLDWEGVRTGRLGPRHRALHALVQASAMAVPPLPTGRAPLMKPLDFVRRIAADFGGAVPTEMARALARPEWRPYAPPLLTMTERLFGLPSPLAADERALRRLEATTVNPRLDTARGLFARLFSRRFLRKLARPSGLPRAALRYWRALTTGRDVVQ